MLYLTVQSGSHVLGQQVFTHYTREGQCELAANGVEAPYKMTWLEGRFKEDYVENVGVNCLNATLNSEAVIRRICRVLRWATGEMLDVAHNYVDAEEILLPKGAISAHKNDLVLIPVNMRDGILVGFGGATAGGTARCPTGRAGSPLSAAMSRRGTRSLSSDARWRASEAAASGGGRSTRHPSPIATSRRSLRR